MLGKYPNAQRPIGANDRVCADVMTGQVTHDELNARHPACRQMHSRVSHSGHTSEFWTDVREFNKTTEWRWPPRKCAMSMSLHEQVTTSASLKEFAAQVRSALGLQLVDLRLFGSVARGDARPDSDIDVLVVVQPDHERKRLARQVVDIAFDVNLAHDVYISPRVVTPEILNHPVWGQTPFLQAVAREGIPM